MFDAQKTVWTPVWTTLNRISAARQADGSVTLMTTVPAADAVYFRAIIP